MRDFFKKGKKYKTFGNVHPYKTCGKHRNFFLTRKIVKKCFQNDFKTIFFFFFLFFVRKLRRPVVLIKPTAIVVAK